MRIRRGSTRGTFTMAISFSRPKASLPPRPHDEVQRLVGHLRKRVRRVQPHRHQQRAHFALEVLVDPLRWARVAVAVRDDFNALLLEVGISSSLYNAYCWATRSWAASESASKDCR
jgi:hypothetical protein